MPPPPRARIQKAARNLIQTAKTLGEIKAQALIMPCHTDMYFRVADNEAEVAQMADAELKVIHSMWGHLAGMPGVSPEDDAFVDEALSEVLAN